MIGPKLQTQADCVMALPEVSKATLLQVLLQVKEIEAAALRAAHDGAMQIENAMAAAADKVCLETYTTKSCWRC